MRYLYAIMVLSLLISFAGAAGGDEMKDYPYQPVPFTKVHFTDKFWLGRMETNRTATIPFAFKQCEDTGRIENFKVAGKLSDKLWEGSAGYNDSDVFKVMEGAAYALMVKPDPKLEKYLEEVISYVAAAQEPDGYLYTAWTAQARKYREKISCCYNEKPWDNLYSSHELYNVGHMYEAAVAHYLATGRRTFLDVAIKNADLICKTFGPGAHQGVPGHQEIEIGLAKLYRVTNDPKYLKQAQWFLNQRGRNGDEPNPYRQSHMPVTEQTEAVGHAVRANYMYSGMADVAAMTGDQSFLKAIDAIWDDVANKKFYVTGGIGALHKGEAYGAAYELPNATAYCETCAAIANVYWNHRMFLLHGQSRYIDVMERSLYNAVLSGVALDGMKFFYPNPLESKQGEDRSPWFGCACCPSNICRFIASVPGYTYAVRDDAVYVNLFVDSTATLNVNDTEIKLTQKTQYPWDGKVTITVEPAKDKQAFALKIRIPDWTADKQTSSSLYTFAEPNKGLRMIAVYGPKTGFQGDGDIVIQRNWQSNNNPAQLFAIAVNDKNTKFYSADGYAIFERTWQKGDRIEVNLPMTIRKVVCDNKVAENAGKAALMRGPLVYCIEGVDVEGANPLDLVLDKDVKLTAVQKADLLGGITVIEGTATETKKTDDGGTVKTARKFQAIPYYAWAHRGKTPMTVWLNSEK